MVAGEPHPQPQYQTTTKSIRRKMSVINVVCILIAFYGFNLKN